MANAWPAACACDNVMTTCNMPINTGWAFQTLKFVPLKFVPGGEAGAQEGATSNLLSNQVFLHHAAHGEPMCLKLHVE